MGTSMSLQLLTCTIQPLISGYGSVHLDLIANEKYCLYPSMLRPCAERMVQDPRSLHCIQRTPRRLGWGEVMDVQNGPSKNTYRPP